MKKLLSLIILNIVHNFITPESLLVNNKNRTWLAYWSLFRKISEQQKDTSYSTYFPR